MFFVESDTTLDSSWPKNTKGLLGQTWQKYKMICFWAVSGHTLSTSHQCVSQTNNNPWVSRGEGKIESQQHKSSSNKVWTGRRFAPSVLTPPKHTQSSFSRKACTMWIETQRRYYRICAWLSFLKNCIYASQITRFTPAVNWKKSPEQKMKSERKYL